MAGALTDGLKAAGIKVLTLKNKYASPTPMGYSDFNLCVGVLLPDGVEYVCEMQLNHVEMLAAKKEAHAHYEKVRAELPPLCPGRGGRGALGQGGGPLPVRLPAGQAPRARG